MPTGNTETIIAQKSKGLSKESINLSIKLAPKVKCICNLKIAVEFKGSCLE